MRFQTSFNTRSTVEMRSDEVESEAIGGNGRDADSMLATGCFRIDVVKRLSREGCFRYEMEAISMPEVVSAG